MERASTEQKIIVLLKDKSMQTTSIAGILGIERHTAVKYLESMESRGLLKHATKRRAKIWALTEAPVLNMLKRKDKAGLQLAEIFDLIDEHISIKNKQFETIWRNQQAENSDISCHETHFNSKERCKNCPVEKTFKTGKAESLEIRFNDKKHKIITRPIKDDNNQTIAVVEIIK
ncbi:MAG: hypothetical protein ACP5N2_07130 [Candidatus Nanoarchaeia archaeon]